MTSRCYSSAWLSCGSCSRSRSENGARSAATCGPQPAVLGAGPGLRRSFFLRLAGLPPAYPDPSTRAAVTHTPPPRGGGGEVEPWTSIFSPCWRLEVQDEVQAGLVSSEAALLGLQMAAFPLGPHPGSPLCLSVSSPLTSTPGILA